MEKLNKIYYELDEVFYENGIKHNQEIFKIINLYQNARLENIEKASNETQRFSLFRTISYFDNEFLEKYKRSALKDQLIHKLVNSFCIQVPELRHYNYSEDTKYMFKEIVKYKDKIINDEEWYLRNIPESEWLLKYLKELQC